MQLYILVGEVTDADVAAIYSVSEGRTVGLGDVEFRVTDDARNPGWSADYASLRSVWRDFPGAMLVRDTAA